MPTNKLTRPETIKRGLGSVFRDLNVSPLRFGTMRHESMVFTLLTRFGIFALCFVRLTSTEIAFRDKQQGAFHVVIIFALIVTDLFTAVSFRDWRFAD